jgi:arylsulfatase A-like enzyme
LVAAPAACDRRETPPLPRPHVFVLVIDTLRADRVGWDGGVRGVSPFLDGLAERGAVFSRAYAPTPWTSPTVASLFTSRYQSQHGITHFASALDPSERTLAAELKAAGYATAGFSANLLINADLGYGRGFDTYHVYFTERVKERAARIHADALGWIDGTLARSGGESLFLYLHYMEPHEPLQPPADTLRSLARRRGRDAVTVGRLEQLARAARPLGSMNAQMIALAEDLYDAEVASLDGELRVFFDELASRGLLETSLVVVTADHGEEFLDHGGIGHGHTLYEELLRVPLLVILPGGARPAVVTDVVSLVDVAPTVLDTVGLPIPASFEGRSHLATLESHWMLRWLSAQLTRMLRRGAAAYAELSDFGATPSRPKLHARTLIEAAAKVIERRDGAVEAYDLTADPGESRSAGLAPPREAVLRAALGARRAELEHNRAARHRREVDDSTRERMRALGYEE